MSKQDEANALLLQILQTLKELVILQRSGGRIPSGVRLDSRGLPVGDKGGQEGEKPAKPAA